MNVELLKNNYLVVPNFIDEDHAKQLEKEFLITDSKFHFNGDPQAPNSAAVYNYLPALELLTNKTSEVSEIVGETVLPTYVYSRIYRNGSVLTKHTDRPACEISMTLHLGGDKPWAIWIETPEGENRCVTLNPGDAMLYLGCVAPHWRDRFTGQNYTQFFLHYVRSRGYCSPTYFDKGRVKREDSSILLKEYEEMAFDRFKYAKESGMIIPKRFRELDDEREQEERIVPNKIVDKALTTDNENVEYTDFDDVIVANTKYSKFLKKTSLDNNKIVKSGLSNKPLKDFIMYKENFIDPEFCDSVLDEYHDTDYWEATLTGSGHDPQARKCSVIGISEPEIINENKEVRSKIDEEFYEIVRDLIDEYQKQCPEFELEIKEDTGYELLRYEVGDFYVEHTDSFKEQPRALTVIMSMNNNYEGGEVALFGRELSYKLDVGDVLVFPSNFMFPHEITKVTSGVRFSTITWVV